MPPHDINAAAEEGRNLNHFAAALGWVAIGGLALICGAFSDVLPWLQAVPDAVVVPLDSWINTVTDWLIAHIKPVTRAISWLLEWPMVGLGGLLHWIPWPATVLLVAWIAWRSGGGVTLVFVCVAALLYVAVSGYWRHTMNTMALVGVAVPLSIGMGMVTGIVANRFRLVEKIVTPTLDLMQTVPTFAYLIPMLVMFGFGPVPGLIASAIYACPPMVRNVMLGLRRVPSEVIEAAEMTGASPRQKLFWVEIPAAMPQIKVGMNQTIMAALSMVIIASVIGGVNDIGWEVLSSMRKARFGESLLAGFVIVLIAIILDRISASFATRNPAREYPAVVQQRWLRVLLLCFVFAGVVLLTKLFVPWSGDETTWSRVVSTAIDTRLTNFVTNWGNELTWLKNQAFYYYLLPLRIGLTGSILPFTWGIEFTPGLRIGYAVLVLACALLLSRRKSWHAGVVTLVVGYYLYFGLAGAPWSVTFCLLVFLGWRAGGGQLALFTGFTLAFIALTGMWGKAMLSAYLCLAAVLMSFVLGSALGVWAAANDGVSRVVRVVCDTFQTIPLFVFLIPVLMVFQIGEFTALLAIVAYAFVPAVRYMESGLRQVSHELIEAAEMQGCTTWQTFWSVKVPVAIPAILVGLNQTVLYAFAMLVIAALVGTTGLGQQVYIALGKASVGLGVVAGLSMAFLAMIVDRMLRSYADKRFGSAV